MVPKSVPLQELLAIVKTNSFLFREVYHERQINNIYFDTNDYRFYFDNVDGVSNRQKVRIRWYGKMMGEIIDPKLEFKIKKGLVGDKWTYNLNSFLMSNQIGLTSLQQVFKDSGLGNPIFEMIRDLKPTLLNSYRRRYFVSANKKFRITLDYDVNYRNIKDKFNCFGAIAEQDSFNVVELKYNLEDDKLANQVTTQFTFRLSKNSKYVNGVNNFKEFPQ